MDGGTALGRVLTVERSFKKEIDKLLLGEGETFHGEGGDVIWSSRNGPRKLLRLLSILR